MKNFSDISIDNTSKKDRIIDNAVHLSGLPRACVSNLYESMFVNKKTNEVDEEQANQMFKDYFGISAPLDINIFSNDIIDHMKKIGDLTNTPEKRKKYTKDLMSVIKKYLDGSDTPTMLQILSTVLCMKDEKSGKKLLQSLDIENLMESDKFDLPKYNDLINSQLSYGSRNTVNDKITSKEIDSMFYSELKDILAERFRDYSSQPIAYRDSYETIMNYVERKATEIQSSLSIAENDERRYDVFIKDLIESPQMNSMYLNVDYLRTITSDLQTMLYDMVILVNSAVEKNSQYRDYIEHAKIFGYNNSLKALLNSIQSSAKSSHLTEADSIYLHDGRYRSIVLAKDCMLIIKQIQNEFAISIRKYINVFLTKAMELLNSYQMIESRLQNTVIVNK